MESFHKDFCCCFVLEYAVEMSVNKKGKCLIGPYFVTLPI